MSWMEGLLLICFLSFCFSIHPLFARRINFYCFSVLVFPLIFTLGFYWGPALVYGAGEYKDWVCVFIVPWLIGGYVGALIGIFLVGYFGGRSHGRRSD